MVDDAEASGWPRDWPVAPGPPPGHGTPGERRWATLAHLSIVPLAIAFPLAVVLGKGTRSPYVCHQAVEALNFQITVAIAVLLCSLTAVVLVGLVLLPVVVLGALALSVRAAVAAHRGAWHRYPWSLRLLT